MTANMPRTRKFSIACGLLLIAGAAGCAGEDGKAGTSGETGTNGANGTQGTNGDPGDPGTTGSDGADGTSPSTAVLNDAVQTAIEGQLPDAVENATQSAVDSAIDKLGATSCDEMQIADADQYDVISEIEYPIKPGEEWEVCKYFKLSDKEFWLHESTHLMNAGSHHGIVYIMPFDEIPTVDPTGKEIPDSGVFPCKDLNLKFLTRPMCSIFLIPREDAYKCHPVVASLAI